MDNDTTAGLIVRPDGEIVLAVGGTPRTWEFRGTARRSPRGVVTVCVGNQPEATVKGIGEAAWRRIAECGTLAVITIDPTSGESVLNECDVQ